MTKQERIETPLTKEETLAAFISTVRAIGGGGCRAGFGRITREDERGVDFTFSLPNFMVRAVCESHPDAITEARETLARQ